jgi:hypothetical protein
MQGLEKTTRNLIRFSRYPGETRIYIYIYIYILKLVVCILLRVLGQVQGFPLQEKYSSNKPKLRLATYFTVVSSSADFLP